MIRTATQHDSLAIAEIHVASWKHTYVGQMPDDVLNNLSVPAREAGWRKLLSEPNSQALVYEEDGVVTGFVNFGPARDGHSQSIRTGEVFSIYRDISHQGRGVGSALWQGAIDTLRAQGYTEIVVWALDTNTVARRFYQRCGCVVDGKPRPITIGGKELREVSYLLKL